MKPTEIHLYGIDEDGMKLCKQCKQRKKVEHYYRSKIYLDGYMYRCKICYLDKDSRLSRDETRKLKYQLETQKSSQMAKMTVCSKEDYRLMYEFLNSIGYDPEKNIAKQFAEKWGVTYKDRKPKDQSYYLSDGSKNPLHRTATKKPPII